MRILLTTLLATTLVLSNAQTTADFESHGLMIDEELDGSDANGGFYDGNIFLPNNYNENYLSFSGWAISSHTDTETPGFANQFSSIVGAGYDNSTTYAVCYTLGSSWNMHLENEARGGAVEGMYVTNTTYAYLSMRDGDAFAKKFGGESGDDPDFFLLTIKKYLDGDLVTSDSIDFYLADYRSADNSEDYIVNEWTWIDLAPLGNCDSLWFGLTSSDVGQFGMNTPSYFCADNIITRDQPTSVYEPPIQKSLNIYPNPAKNKIHIEGESPIRYVVYNASGEQVLTSESDNGQINSIDIQALPTGSYSVVGKNKNGLSAGRFIKTD